MLKITGGKGFHITFDNGVTVSVQFGWGNYCDNYSIREDSDAYMLESKNAEIAIWDKNEDWITKEYDGELCDDVKGYVEVKEILDILNWASKRGEGQA